MVPTPIVDQVTEVIAPDRVLGVQPGIVTRSRGSRSMPSRRVGCRWTMYGFGEELSGGAIRFLGYVIDAGGVRIYHAGDTIHFESMEASVRALDQTWRCSR